MGETAQEQNTHTAHGKETTAIPPQAVLKRRRKRYLLLLSLGVLIAAGLWSAYYYFIARFYETTDDAYVNDNIITITPRVEGTVVSIAADDGDYVMQGQVLVQLDDSDFRVALQNTEATLARRRDLARSGAIAAEEISHARDAFSAAKSALEAAEQNLKTSLALVDNTELKSHPDIRATAAQLEQAYLDKQRTEIPAPASGYIAKRSVQVGNHVVPGTTLMAVIPLQQLWIDANFKENQMRGMRIGQKAVVTTDLYGRSVQYHGIVESLGIGTGSAFSLLPPQNASGNWIKIVQRLPVRIRLTADNLDTYPLRIGLSTRVTVDLRDGSGPLLPTAPPAQARFSTDVYARQLSEAQTLIQHIINENDIRPAPAETPPQP